MRNRIIPLTMLLVLLLFAYIARRPGTSTAPSRPVPDGSADDRSAGNRDRRDDRDNRYDRDNRTARESRDNRTDREAREARDDRPDRDNDRDPPSPREASRRGNHSVHASTPGVFDFYLLNLSWSPEFCATHPSAAECSRHLGFILHGLWPQNTDGTYPEACADTPPPPDLGSFSDITPNTSLLLHEWFTHGTCSGLPPDQFFALARTALRSVAIPRTLSALHEETSATPADLLADFARANPSFPPTSLALSCGNNRLSAIEVCMDKSAHPIACTGIRSCRANSIRITPP